MVSTAKKKKLRGEKKSPTKLTGSSWRTGTWIGLLVFVSVWMFVLGILVGRGTVPTRLGFDDSKKELYALAEEAAKKEKKSDPLQETTAKMTRDVPDPFDGLKKSGHGGSKKDDLFLNQTDRPKPVARKLVKQPKKPEKAPATKTESPPRQEPPQTTSSSTVPDFKPKRKAVVINYRTLQTASMRDLAEAKQMVIRLRQKGYKAYVASAAVSGKGVQHRVRIGPYKNETDAGAALDRLKKEGIHAIILR